MKGWHHSDEAKARIGVASRARRSASIALAAMVERANQRKLLILPKPKRKILTDAERKAANKKRAAAWCEKNKERSRAIKRAHYARNREILNAKQREKNKTAERKAYVREYAPKHRAMNREKYAEYSVNRCARERGAIGRHSKDDWRKKVEECGGKCAYCGLEKKLSRDHDIPLSRNGTNFIENIVPACGSCNSAKGTMTRNEFIRRIRNQCSPRA